MQRFEANHLQNETLLIAGAGGRLGQDLGALAVLSGINLTKDPAEASLVALCTPSYVAEDRLDSGIYAGRTIIDLSGAAKRRGICQYGLMRTEYQPWDDNFDTSREVYGNPGCIASAVILGLARSGLSGQRGPKQISVVSVGGKSHAPNIETSAIKLAKRTIGHPHVAEIEKASKLQVNSFLPVMADVPEGLLVTVTGQTDSTAGLDYGVDTVNAANVVGTANLEHKLEVQNGSFSLAVAMDNVRFVTTNALNLVRYVVASRGR